MLAIAFQFQFQPHHSINMNTQNLNLWKSVCITDPSAVKPITGKQYKGNSPKPYWIIEQATKAFGPCGIGWGIQVASERFERFGDTESLHIALVRVWYVLDGKKGEIEQMGQTRSSYVTSSGKFIVDEDAPKKSVTDGMVKCLSMLGFAGDIFSGQWDDSRYVEFAGNHHATNEQIAAIEAAKTVDILKSHFAAAWKMSDDQTRPSIKAAYDKRLRQLTDIAAAQQEKILQQVADESKYQ